MTHKLGICIPYRNRKDHLDRLIPHLGKFLNERGIEHKFYVAHQVDDKLFNRGAMKNIAAKRAFEDGCDYIAWHDVDMLPYDDTCDYSYPSETPIHIATKLSKYSYSMGYEQYFGGVVLFTKEQVEKTNGYSNEYWDWGQEDDDLFYRCYYENYTNNTIFEEINNKSVGNFNGKTSYVKIPMDRSVSSLLNKDHTISILVNSEQQPEKVPIWLVGDKERKFIEYPILRKEGSWSWGVSFNNSRTYNVLYFDVQNNPLYNWAKRHENEWTRFTISYKEETDELYVFMNDQMVSNNGDILRNKPIVLPNKLKYQTPVGSFILGFCPQSGTYFKGQIGELKIYDHTIESYEDMENSEPVLDYSFGTILNHENRDTEIVKEDIKIVKNILPHRREGSFYCLPHQDLGFVNGKWHQGETTAKNEKRFVTEMQQGKINYKEDGMNSLKYELVELIQYSENCEMLNVKL